MEKDFIKTNCTFMSEDCRQIGTALLEARKKMQGVENTGFNSFAKRKYKTLGDIQRATLPHLMDQGIMVSNSIDQDPDKNEIITTRLTHVISGQWIQNKMFLICEKQGNQERGAAITYAMKYALLLLCTIADYDDDCQEEQNHINEKNISPEQAKELEEMVLSSKNPGVVLKNILEFNKVRRISELPVSKFNAVQSYIRSQAN